MLIGNQPNAATAAPPLARIAHLRGKRKTIVSAMSELVQAAQSASRELSASEQAKFGTLKADADRIEASVDHILAAAGSTATVKDGALTVIENRDSDPHRGFAHFGEFASAVLAMNPRIRNGRPVDPRIGPLASAPGTAANEGAGTDGGILVPPGFGESLFTLSLDEDSLLPMTDEIQIGGNNMLLPKDETTPWGTTGPRAFWQGENTQGTLTKPVITGLDLRLKKLMGLTAITNELAADSLALGQYLPKKLASSIRWKSNEAILYGNGAGMPLGALGAALITVAKDTGQASYTLSATNLATMLARLPPGSFPRSFWLINNDLLPALFTLTLGNLPIYLPTGQAVGAFQDSPYGTLLGRPVVVSQHAKTFSAAGDITLMDLSYYQTITKAGGMTMATSMHLYFDADAMAFRVTFRMDGAPKLTAAITPANGVNKLSPFVQLGAR